MCRWLAREGTAAELAEFEAMRRRREGFVALVERTRARLAALYAQALEPSAMREAKARVFAQMRAGYEALKCEWGGFSGCDRWFAQPLGNAHPASVAVYTQQVPAFAALLAACGGEHGRFHAAVRKRAALPEQQRGAARGALAAGSGAGCNGGKPVRRYTGGRTIPHLTARRSSAKHGRRHRHPHSAPHPRQLPHAGGGGPVRQLVPPQLFRRQVHA